jgi:hypothetical protein
MSRAPLTLPAMLLLWSLLWLLGVSIRPPFPIDETRYLTVAWEMYQRNDWVLLHLNGAPYSHKPPLLFWLINLGWGAVRRQRLVAAPRRLALCAARPARHPSTGAPALARTPADRPDQHAAARRLQLLAAVLPSADVRSDPVGLGGAGAQRAAAHAARRACRLAAAGRSRRRWAG